MNRNPQMPLVNSILLSIYLLMTMGIELEFMSKYHFLIRLGLFVFPFLLQLLYKIQFSVLSIIVFLGGVLFCLFKGYFFIPLIYVISAPILAKFVLSNRFELKMLYITYGIIGFFFVNAALHDTLNDFMMSSRNYVSIKLLFTSTLITLIAYRQCNKVIIWPAIFTLIMSIMAVGRGGILCSSLNFLALLYIRYIRNLNNKFKFLILFLMIVPVILYWSAIEDFYDASDQLARVREMGFEDTAREDIWEEYFSNIDLATFFTGYDFTTNRWIHGYEDNPHNSFILLHAYLGIFILVPIYLLLYSFYSHLKRKQYIYILPLIVLIIRSFTDVIFLNYYDFIIIIFVYHSFMENKIAYLH